MSIGLTITIVLASVVSFVLIIFIIVNEVTSLEDRKIVKSKLIYDFLKLKLTKKVPNNVSFIFGDNIHIRKIPSIFFPYEIGDLGCVFRWSKSGRLISSFCLSKRQTNKLEQQKIVDRLWNKEKNKQN